MRVTQPDPNNRSSAYDVYDNYLADAGPLPSKHAALAMATGARDESPPPQYIAAPRPGYAAPVDLTFSRPDATASPGGRQPVHDPDYHPNNPFNNPVPRSPMMHSTPHPLEAPITPITPVFARPHRDTASPDSQHMDEKPPIRGDAEDTLLPRRGERGDDFWRRFSMVVKEEDVNTKKGLKNSKWLTKTEAGTRTLSTWVWVVGVLLLVAAGAGIGIGWYVSHNSPDHVRPVAIGGSDDKSGGGPSSAVASVKTSLHVSPTNTVDRRAAEPFTTPIPVRHAARNRRRRSLDLD